jgi:uncharacterized protein YdhG (YjbR/CyaY superfamily)
MSADAHDGYLGTCDPVARERLLAIRAAIESAVPDTSRTMAYQTPALRKGPGKGRVIAYFASFRHHIGIYPPVTAPAGLVAELAPYAGPKGNLAFPHKDPLPVELIGRVGAALAAQYGQQP